MYQVRHVTTYRTTEPVSVCHNIARLRPRETPFQHVRDYQLLIDPEASARTERFDTFGNSATYFSASAGYSTLSVESQSSVEVSPPSLPSPAQTPAWDSVGAVPHRIPGTLGDPRQFLFDSPRIYRDSMFRDYALQSFQPGAPLLEAVQSLSSRIFDEFTYDPTATNVSTPIREVFNNKAGVCQDFAHLQIAMLRSIGLPTRYVSGYIRTYPAEGQQALVGSAASHAWLSVYTGDPAIGDNGWVDTDPTNNKFLTDEYITVAWGRDYSDVAPLKGVFVGSGQHELDVEVTVNPVGPS